MNGILLNTEGDCDYLIEVIDNKIRFLFGEGTKTYTYYIKHPDRNEYAVIIDVEDITLLINEYPVILAEFNGLVDQVEELTPDWIIEEEL